MESNLLTQINVLSPLPSFLEVEVVSNLSRSLHKTFQFAHVLLAEKVNAAALLLPYNDEMYFVMIGLLERMLLFNADTTFTELLFSLRRGKLTGPTAALPPRPALSSLLRSRVEGRHTTSWCRWLRFVLLGPSPMLTPEQRAMLYVNDPERYKSQSRAVPSSAITASRGNDLMGKIALTDAINSDAPPPPASLRVVPDIMNSCAAGTLEDTVVQASTMDQLTALEKLSADRSSYGHLSFKPLTKTQKMISLLLLTLKPYLEKKIADWYASETDDATDAVAMRDAYAHRYPVRAKILRFLVKYVYPFYHITTETASFFFKLCYLLELTPYSSAPHRLVGIALRRATAEDALTASNPRAQRAMLISRMLLLLIFFGFNVLEFSRNAGGTSTATLGDEALPLPPPPVVGVDVPLPEIGDQPNFGAPMTYPVPTPGSCPICRKRVTNAAVCGASGIVGCYPCLQEHVRTHRTCPVTGKGMSEKLIRRIFEC